MSLLARTQKLSDDLYNVVDGRPVRSGVRERLAGGSFDAVHEHHRSVALLVQHGLYGSAFVLLRPMFDGCINGMWLTYLANDGELDRFANNRLTPEPTKVIKRLKKNDIHSSDILHRINQSAWKSMSSYVHGGYLQVVRRNSEEFLGSNYAPAEIEEVLGLANWFALLAAVEITQLSNNPVFFNDVISIAQGYVAAQG
ncbi:MAG: hypothetical protein IPG66_17450 [Hydrogenophilales bacterium]|nr:hypothetical protein [Hydrogenophilales bacterium]